MAEENITLKLDRGNLDELRSLVGEPGLAAAVDEAIDAHLSRLRQLIEADEWIEELKAHDARRSESS